MALLKPYQIQKLLFCIFHIIHHTSDSFMKPGTMGEGLDSLTCKMIFKEFFFFIKHLKAYLKERAMSNLNNSPLANVLKSIKSLVDST